VEELQKEKARALVQKWKTWTTSELNGQLYNRNINGNLLQDGLIIV
jgi:hypothetical protein